MAGGNSRVEVLAWVQSCAGRALDGVEQADLLASLPLALAETLVSDFAVAFDVDLQGYEPDLHRLDRTGPLRLDWPVPAPRAKGQRIPVSISLLVAAAQAGTWPLTPPEPMSRPDFSWVNLPVLGLGLPLLTLALLWLVRAVF